MKSLFLTLTAIFATITVTAAPNMLEPDDHTAAFWDFSIQKNGLIEDQSGFGNNITLGSFDKAPLPIITSNEGMILDNQGGYAQLKPKDSLKIRKGDFAIEVVFKAKESVLKKNGLGFSLIGNKSFSEKVSGFHLAYSTWQNYSLSFKYALNENSNSFDVKLTEPLKADTWYTVCISRDGEKLQMKLDGKLVGESIVAGNLNLSNLRPIRIGVYSAAWQRDKQNKIIVNGLVGTIRCIRISDQAR